ncbi:S8 family peptidase [Methylocystis sp. SB2]|uniref:S8 family peptidase n=1 Tax=Methylocystis sp. (strain SB2) TaxID=743836 RepID=UPI0003FD86C5|nr:S8 family peptidase [Methylocystis sp. SB2]ULO23149.1 S8 family peptidase [Methylocystis sp. SB2]
MTSPVQVILNAENFTENRDKPSGGGPKTDFFARDDAGFVAHRKHLVAQIKSIVAELERQTPMFGQVGFVKVILRRKAWAKSHRPTHALFREEWTPLVGGLDLGQLLVEATPTALTRISQEIARAEDRVEWRYDKQKGRDVPYPTGRRSEAGAIESIELYGAGDRRKFDLDQAVVWLSSTRTGGRYEVELFEAPPPQANWDALGNRQQLFRSFVAGLQRLGQGLRVELGESRTLKECPHVTVRLEQSALPPRVQLTPEPATKAREVAPFDPSRDRHARLLAFLEHHPLVRRIDLPGVVTRSAETGRRRPNGVELPKRISTRSWPRVGVIDGGVSDTALGEWIIGRWGLLADEDIDAEHGTFIGGILVAGSQLNGAVVSNDPDGMEIFDVAVFPATDAGFGTYHGDLTGFLNEVENAIVEARTRHNVRVFNFSLNIQNAVTPDYYSKVAARFDQIADAHDVVIFISAGNLVSLRKEWPKQPEMALQLVAESQNDGILVPAESARNVSVGSLNAPGVPGTIGHAPACYTRRGPGLRALVKPDFAFIGGSGSPHPSVGHGLFSLSSDGLVTDGCGTSYATPFLAKQAALLDAGIEGNVSRETLIALLAHHARAPGPLQDKLLDVVGRQLAGHGVPNAVADILEGDDHQITLVFAARLMRDKQLNFGFTWPTCLVESGKCRGGARLTLVASPPLDQRFGAEFVRINIEAALQQETTKPNGKTSWKGQLKPLYLPSANSDYPFEAERIEHGLKWSPVKVYGDTLKKGRGNSSTWRLLVEYLSRSDNQEMPPEGVPFTAILTIRDPRGEEPVFSVMRQQLALNVQLSDIRTAARVTSRV